MTIDNKVQLAIFDMEGTIFRKAVPVREGTAASAWTLIAQELGPKALAEEETTKVKWMSGEYQSYTEWMEDTIRVHKKYGLTKTFFDQVMGSVPYHPGVHETFQSLRERGIKTALISGGFKAQADRAQRDLLIDHVFAACEYIWDGEELLHWNLLPCDYAGKLAFMKILCEELKISAENTAFIGDGENDVILAKAVGMSVCFNGVPKLQQACTYSIIQPLGHEDFRAVLRYI